MKRLPLAMAALVCTTLAAHAQPGARDHRSPSTTAPVLRGPTVDDRPRDTLVRRDSDGVIERPETPPEVAALRLLRLPDDVRHQIDALLLSRDRFMDSLVENNLDLLSKLDTAGKTNDKLDQAMLAVAALSRLAPLAADGSLKMKIRRLLPADEATHFDALLKEYWDAVVEQERHKDPKKGRWQVITAERFQSLGREISAAFQRLQKSGTLLYHYFFQKTTLTKDQEGEIRAILDEFVEQTKGSPTPQQVKQVFIAVMSHLTVAQQTELVREFKKRQGPPAASPAPRKGVRAPRGDARSPAR